MYLSLVVTLTVCVSYTLADIYYITPALNTPCPGIFPCFNLSEYATKSRKNYFQYISNVNLILLPGNHWLDSEFMIENNMTIYPFFLRHNTLTVSVTTDSTSNATIFCSQSGTLSFKNIIQYVNISKLQFFGCTNISINSVSQFRLENCSLDGQGHNGTGLVLNAVNNVIIERSIFSSYTGMDTTNTTFRKNTYCDKGGGTIFAFNCGNVTIFNSAFTNNTVYSTPQYVCGGAVFLYNSPTAFNNCTLNNNALFGRIDSYGGAVYADSIRSTYNITLDNCTFTNNAVNNGSGGTVYILRAFSVSINSCVFENNSITGNGGAVQIISIQHLTVISNNIFMNNCAFNGEGGAVYVFHSSIAFDNCSFINNTVTGENGNGGAVSITNQLNVENTTLNRCRFISNTASGKGGALYLSNTKLITINYINGFLDIKNNTASIGGVLYATKCIIVLWENITISNNHGSLYAQSCNVTLWGYINITNNSHSSDLEGGAVTGIQSEINFNGISILKHNTASSNGGAISVTQSKLYFDGTTTIANNLASSSGGGIYANHSELNFRGSLTNITENNARETGGGVHVINSTIKLTNGDKTFFVANHAKKGGGAYFERNAKLYIIKTQPECTNVTIPRQCLSNKTAWLRLEFSENSASYGGAMYVDDYSENSICFATPFRDEPTIFNECFFQALGYYNPNNTHINILNTFFTNNSAKKAGNVLYGGLLDRCTVNRSAEWFAKYPDSSRLSVMSYILNITNLNTTDFNSTEMISSHPVRVCFCQDNQPNCDYHHNETIQIRKGQLFNESLVAVDQVNNIIPHTIIKGSLSPSSQRASLGEGKYIQQTYSNGSCTNLTYAIFAREENFSSIHAQLNLYTDGPCRTVPRNISIEIRPCPIGFEDVPIQGDCECSQVLRKHGIVSNCLIGIESVQRKGNSWFTFINTTDHPEGYIFNQHCPFDYCKPPTENVFVNLNIPNGSDALCAYDHSGNLCGSCEDGLSLSLGSSRCKQCSNNWLALLVVFAIAGVALVAFLLVFNFTVAVGSINGLIFYANIIAANSAILLPFDKPNILTVFIAWLNLDFGFETCFYDGMDAYAKTWLQLVFPTYVIVLVAMVIIISQLSWRFSQLLSNRNPVATLATLILLSYTKTIRMTIAALSSTTLNYSDGSKEKVWVVDANMLYLNGRHIPLFIAALIILLVGVMFSFFLFFWQWLLRCPNTRALKWIQNTKLNSFMDAYCAPYTPQHRYWTGLLLLARVLLYGVFASNVLEDSTMNLFAIACVTGCLLALMAIFKDKVYRKWPLTIIETSFIFNLIFISVATLYNKGDGKDNNAFAYTSISIAFITFIATLAYHTYTFVIRKHAKGLTERLPTVKIGGIKPKKDNQKTENRNLIDSCRYSKIREPLDLIESESISVNDNDELKPVLHTGGQRVTYSVINGP